MSDMAKEQVRYAYPRYKVFIFGVEVTDDTVGITVNNHDGGAPNTCQITLLNEFDKYIITTDDMAALAQVPGGIPNIPWMKGLKSSGQGPINTPDSSAAPTITSPRKAAILRAKNSVIQNVSISDREGPTGTSISDTNLTNYYGTSIKRYPLADGAPIFNSMDPVRIAMRDPFDPSRWYWHFSGFVSDMVDNTNENNQKTLTIVVEDPTKLFRYTRVFLNPGIIDANAAISQEDLRAQSFYSNFLRGLTLPEMFFTLFFGPDKAGTEKILQKNVSASGTSNLSTKLRGIGHFALDSSSYFLFGPDASTVQSGDENAESGLMDVKPPVDLGTDLQIWQSLIDHEVQPSDLYTMATESDRSDSSIIQFRGSLLDSVGGKLDIEDVIDLIGTNPQDYLIDGGRLMMLIPNSLGADNRKIVIEDIIQSYAMNSEWHAAGQLMQEVVDRIQFVMYATPKGDIVIEPPLYDFNPGDFGLTQISADNLIDILPRSQPGTSNAATELIAGERMFRGNPRGPYGTNYIVQKRDTFHWESAFVDEKVYTIGICPHSIVQNWESVGNTSIVGDLAVVKLLDLIPLYGVRPVPIEPRGFLASKEAATLFANITLNKLNADSHTCNISHVPNITLWLNRPLYIEGRNFIGTTKQLTHAITWGASGDMSTTSDLYAIRTWGGQVAANDPTEPVWTTIGGQGSKPLDYSILWKKAVVPDPNEARKDTSLGINSQQIDGIKTIPQF